MHVNLFNFTKKNNSTKRPAANTAVTLTGVKFKEPVNMRKPDLVFQTLDAPFSTYKYLSFKDRFYFVDSWEYNSPCWIAHCHLDVLATYKNEIGKTKGTISRMGYSDATDDLQYLDVVDDEIIPYEDYFSKSIKFNPYGTSHINSYENGTFIVSFLSDVNKVTGVGSLAHIIFSTEEYQSFQNQMANVATQVKSDFITPYTFIKKVRWYPFSPALVKQSVDTITSSQLVICGQVFLNIFSSFTYIKGFKKMSLYTNVNIGNHSQYKNLGQWVNVKGRQATIVSYPYGVVTLSNLRTTSLRIGYDIDLISGRALFKVFDSLGNILINAVCPYGAEMPFVYTDKDILPALSGAISGAVNLGVTAATGSIGGAVKGGVSLATSLLSAGTPQAVISGGQDPILCFFEDNIIYMYEQLYYEPDRKNIGYAIIIDNTCIEELLPSYPEFDGYVRFNNMNFSKGSFLDNQEVNNFMNGGFFYE